MCMNQILTGQNFLILLGFAFIFLVVADALLRYFHGSTPDGNGKYYGDKLFPWKFLARLYFIFPEEEYIKDLEAQKKKW